MCPISSCLHPYCWCLHCSWITRTWVFCICLTFCIQGNMNLDKILYSHKFVSKKGLTLILLVLSFLFLLAISELNYTPVNCCCTNYRAFQSWGLISGNGFCHSMTYVHGWDAKQCKTRWAVEAESSCVLSTDESICRTRGPRICGISSDKNGSWSRRSRMGRRSCWSRWASHRSCCNFWQGKLQLVEHCFNFFILLSSFASLIVTHKNEIWTTSHEISNCAMAVAGWSKSDIKEYGWLEEGYSFKQTCLHGQ